MSKPEDPKETPRESVPDLSTEALAEALGSMGLLPPETSEEVRLAEAELDERSVELPPSLRNFRRDSSVEAIHDAETGATNDNVVPLRRSNDVKKTRNAWRYATGFALGAAAASVLWMNTSTPPVPAPTVGGASSELTSLPTPTESKLTLELAAACEQCCAGARCGAAAGDLSSCASGRECISCTPADVKNAYKIRISALGLNDAGRRWAEARGGVSDLEVCADIRGRSLGCRSATEQPSDFVEWASLPIATTNSQLVGGLRVVLRATGTATKDAETARDSQLANTSKRAPLASWSSAVSVSPETLCRGVAARLALPDGEVIGRISAFFDDTYFVELQRAGSVKQLLAAEERFEFHGGHASIYEASTPGTDRFVLAIGPTTRARADALRWQLLDQGFESRITFGDDHQGPPRPR